MASDKLKILFFLFSIFSYQSEISAQNKKMVKSKSYDLLLKKLLKHNVPEVSVDSLKNLQDVLLLDAREIDEYNVSHLKNANWVGYKTFNIESLHFKNKNQPIVVYAQLAIEVKKSLKSLLMQALLIYGIYTVVFLNGKVDIMTCITRTALQTMFTPLMQLG